MLKIALVAVAALAAHCAHAQTAPMTGRFAYEEATIASLQAAMAGGRLTSEDLVRTYRRRIEEIDATGPTLRSVVEVNPDAVAIARERDRERKDGRLRGPLHGVPIVLKDNIDTGDRMLTTAGSLSLAGAPAAEDAFVVARLREAGAVILGKTNLSEWANMRSPRSLSGWSARGGLTRNPYVLDRSACGSSSGTAAAVAANLAAVGVGTETDGSIVCPAAAAGLVGVKPTVGLLSRSGIVPIAQSQDTAGPMARTVADAAILLGAMTGVDTGDPATSAAEGRSEPDYRRLLAADALKGRRIGVMRRTYTGYSAPTDALFERALADLKRLGVEIVDPADLEPAVDVWDDEVEVLLFELKDGLNRYLATRRGVAVRTLADVIAFNETNAATEMPWFGQAFLVQAQAKGSLADPAYLEKAARIRKIARDALDGRFEGERLDALVAPTSGPAWVADVLYGDPPAIASSTTPAAVSGYPSVTVPMGFVHGLPVGISFVGPAWSEGRLLALAYAYEQGTAHRRPPAFLPAVR